MSSIDALLERVAPNWFAAVMGTGILTICALTVPLPASTAALARASALGTWWLAATLLIVVTALTGLQWWRRPEQAKALLRHPVLAHFHGAAPMALMTVGAGAVLLDGDSTAAIRLDWLLWTAGTALGLVTATILPYRLLSGRLGPRERLSEAAFGGWLMPVVPPVVSASTGALLLEHTPPGLARLTLLIGCSTMLGLGVLASTVVIALVCIRLVRHGAPAARMAPTLWIVLGPLGQSATAAIVLGERAPAVLDPHSAAVVQTVGMAYGATVLGLALLWAGIAARLTVRTVRGPGGLPFAATWWAFTFPIGTCATGAGALARTGGAQGMHPVSLAAAACFAVLVCAWIVVSVGTLRSTGAPSRLIGART